MEDVEIYIKLQSFRVFKVHYLNNKYTNLLNYDELLTELNKQKSFWERKDKKYKFEKCFSQEIEIVITKLKEAHSNINENVLSSNYALTNHFYTTINFKYDWINTSNSNGQLIINFNFFACDDSCIRTFSQAYVYCLLNDKKDVLKEVTSLYLNTSRINEFTSAIRNTPKYSALILYLSLETKNVKKVDIPLEITEEIGNIKSEIQLVQNDLSKSKEELSKFNIQYHQELRTWVDEKNQWFQNKESEIEKIKQRYLERMDELESLYAEKLKLEEPSQYWSEKANEYKSSFRWYLVGTILISIILLVISNCLQRCTKGT